MLQLQNANVSDLESINSMSEEELDGLPFGAIRLDKSGKVLSYNATEAKLTGRDPKRVIGRNFFTDVAPCTNVQSFAGRFREGVEKGDMHVIFPYRFDFQMAPRDVTVTLFYSKQTEAAWVFVRETPNA
ncbi:MAG TPA: photoactive yellow protein [Thermoanaerobaculia bacterium]|nr:photoactive yellow protein [Thermoanaerobaculia bacterium]